MPVMRLNHAVLYVRDAHRSAAFYTEVLGFVRRRIPPRPSSCRRRAPPTTTTSGSSRRRRGPASPAGRGAVGLYHLAWEVDTLDELNRLAGVLQAKGALVGAPTTARPRRCTRRTRRHRVRGELAGAGRPAGPAARGAHGPLDLAAEIARYGADTRGGMGVSVAVR